MNYIPNIHTHTHKLPSHHQMHTYTLTSKPQLLLINALTVYTHVHILHTIPGSILLKAPQPLWIYAWPSLYTTSTHTLTHAHNGWWDHGQEKETNKFLKQNQEALVRPMLLKDIFHLWPLPAEWQSTKQSFKWLKALDILASSYHETSLMFALNACS